MGMLRLIAVAGAIGLVCHWVTSRIGRPGHRITPLILVSVASSLVTAWFCFLITYVQVGEVPEPPGVPILIAILSFPVSLAAGVPFWRSQHVLPGHCEHCGYNLTGNTSDVCPECGSPLDSDEPEHRMNGAGLKRSFVLATTTTRYSSLLVGSFWILIPLVALLLAIWLS